MRFRPPAARATAEPSAWISSPLQLVKSVEASAKRSCAKEVRKRMFAPDAEISVGRDIKVTGDRATAVVREQNGNVSKLSLVRQSAAVAHRRRDPGEVGMTLVRCQEPNHNPSGCADRAQSERKHMRGTRTGRSGLAALAVLTAALGARGCGGDSSDKKTPAADAA